MQVTLKTNKSELTKIYNSNPNAYDVEIYQFRSPMHSIHTDSITSIYGKDEDGGDLFDDIDQLPDREFEAAWMWMDEAEYNQTILANSSITADFAEWYGDKNAQVLVIILGENEDPEMSNGEHFAELYDGDVKTVETTCERNGYPARIRKAYILPDIEDFDQLKEIADEWGLELIKLDKCSGWNLWHRGDVTYHPLDLATWYREKSDYDVVDYIDDEEDFMDEMSYMLEGITSIEALQQTTANLAELWEKMCTYGEDYQYVLYLGAFDHAIHVRPVSDDYDSRQDHIALIDPESL